MSSGGVTPPLCYHSKNHLFQQLKNSQKALAKHPKNSTIHTQTHHNFRYLAAIVNWTQKAPEIPSNERIFSYKQQLEGTMAKRKSKKLRAKINQLKEDILYYIYSPVRLFKNYAFGLDLRSIAFL